MKAQDILQTIDSLDSVAKNQEGKERINTLIQLSRNLKKISFDEAVVKMEQAEREAWDIKDNHLIASTNLELAESYKEHYDIDLVEPYLRVALEYVGDDYALQYDLYQDLAYLNLNMGYADSAMFFYEKSRDAAFSMGNRALYADAVNNMAWISRNQGDQDQALKGFVEAVRLYYEINDSLSAARALNNVAMIYSARQQYDEALSIFDQVIPFFERRGENKDLARNYSNLGLITSRYTGDVDKSLEFFGEAMHYAKLGGDSLMMVDVQLNEGDIYLMCGNIDEAFLRFEEAKVLSARLGFDEGLAASYVRLAEGFFFTGNYAESVENIRLCMELEQRNGVYLYTPLLNPYLMMNYAHLGEFDSLESEITRHDAEYYALLGEKNRMESENGEVGMLREENAVMKAKANKLQYVIAGLATLLVVLFIYTIISGRPKKEK